MGEIVSLGNDRWDAPCSPVEQGRAVHALERGSVVWFPRLAFVLGAAEHQLLSPAIAGAGKNISFDPSSGVVRGHCAEAADGELLQAMMLRFAVSSTTLLRNLLPRHEAGLRPVRTSFRPVEIAGRSTSWRKDDTRLHVDSFPSRPTRGARILRVFTNINPDGRTRTWRLGEPFEDVARRNLHALRGPVPGIAALLQVLRITKGRRSAYDHLMLRLHDRMKADLRYQAEVAYAVHEFPPGSTWIAYTDQVSHAAMAGQYALEQTFFVALRCMHDRARSPLGVLERLLARNLV
jgi:hypothetical protein